MDKPIFIQSVPWANIKWSETTIICLLIIISLIVATIIIIKFIVFINIKKHTRLYMPELIKILEKRNWAEVLKLSTDYADKCYIAKVLMDGLERREYLKQSQALKEIVSLHTGEEMERSTILIQHRIMWGIGILDAIGATSPFIGVLGGTGITLAFGTILAIPTLWFATHFRNKIRMFEIELKHASSTLMTQLEVYDKLQSS